MSNSFGQKNERQGTFPNTNPQTLANKQVSQKAVNTIADVILKAVEMHINKLQKRIDRLERAVGIHESRPGE